MLLTEAPRCMMKDEEEETISEYSIKKARNIRQYLSVDESLLDRGVRIGRRRKKEIKLVRFIKCCYQVDDKLKLVEELASPLKSININSRSVNLNMVIERKNRAQITSLGSEKEDSIIMDHYRKKHLESNSCLRIEDCCSNNPASNYVMILRSRFDPLKRPSIEQVGAFERLLKLIMFLIATILYSHQLFVIQANCQKHYFHRNNHQNQNIQFLQSTNQDHLMMRLNQRQAIEGLFKGHANMKDIKHQQALKQQQQIYQQQQQSHLNHHYLNHNRHQNYRHNQMDSPQRIPQPLNADRRASGGGGGVGISANLLPQPTVTTTATGTTSQPSQANQKDNGKLLVCYYTTRQSAPYWPKDAREYVIPADGLNSINGANDLSQMAFAPILRYEPFARVDHRNSNNQNNEAQQASPDFPSTSNIKNQQQQLVFKSAAMVQQKQQQQQQQQQQSPQQQLLTGGPSIGGVGINTKAMFTSYNNGNKSKQLHHHSHHENAATISLLLEQQHQQQHLLQQPLNNNIDQQTLVIAGQPIDNTFGSKNKQTPAYSFIGDLDSNSGLIFHGGSGTVSPTLPVPINPIGGSSLTMQQQQQLLLNHSGNNGNDFMFGKDNKNNSYNTNYNNNGNHQERNLIKHPTNQAQQLVFSPSMSRTFVVGTNSNNEILDTKSQLPISSQPQQTKQSAQTSHNNQLHQQQTTSTINSNLSLMYQQQQQQHDLVALQKAKSLQLTNTGEQLSQALHLFSGPVSSTPPVPLSSASSSLVQHTTAASYRNSQHHNYPTTTANNNQQKQFVPNANQLIFSSGQKTSSTQKASNTAGGNSLPSMKLSYPISAANSVNSSLGGKSSLSSSSSSSPSSSSPSSAIPSLSDPGPSSSTSGASLPLSSSSSSQALDGSSGGGSSISTSSSSGSGNLSSALVSSPLSTMFDVFGAASQYLMRFKPSSLISPATFTFNTIPNDHHSQHHGLNIKSTNSSLLNSLSSGSPASLIPLPFTNSLTSSLQKPLPPSSSNDRSSASNSGSSSVGVISRFALQNNQRREDVCGKTIQTPQRRIIGGEGARYGEFPYQVHIKIAKHQCGGALVDKQSIVTAAHCVYHFITRAPVSKLQIVIGAYDIEDEQYQELPPQYFKVNKVKLHPNFRFSASHPDRYDIAILKLDKPVKYTDNVLPVCLPSKDLKFESMVGTVTGFGKTDPSLSNRYGTRLLQKVDVPIIENNECERWHRTRGIDLKIFPEMMCAGYEDGLKDACVGDSGGPLVVKTAAGPNGSFRWTLAGITSAGFGCAQSRQPGIYHRVSHTVDWILQNLD